MAQRTIIKLVDDVEDRAIKQGEGETVILAVEYEIDMSKANADKLRQALALRPGCTEDWWASRASGQGGTRS
jgi:hypothetical protein